MVPGRRKLDAALKAALVLALGLLQPLHTANTADRFACYFTGIRLTPEKRDRKPIYAVSVPA